MKESAKEYTRSPATGDAGPGRHAAEVGDCGVQRGRPTRGHIKDIEFSPEGIRRCRAAGVEDTLCVPESGPKRGEFDPLKALLLHEVDRGVSSEDR